MILFLLLVLVWQQQYFFLTVGSCVTTIRYPFFLYAWSVGWWGVGLEFEVDVHEWWSDKTEWKMMGMDGHKMLYRKWKWLMLSGSSWHLPKSLINQKLMLFYLKCYLHGSLGWHEWTGVCWSYVGLSDAETDVYESWNWMRLNLIHVVVLVACKTANCWKKMERNCKTTETNDATSHCWNH